MIHQNVELFNTVEVVPLADDAVGLRRVPESVRRHLNPHCQYQMTRSACGEIRFVTDDGVAEVTLSVAPNAENGDVQAVIYYGGFRHGPPVRISPGEPRTLAITPSDRIPHLPTEMVDAMPFHTRVIRIMLWGVPAAFHGATGKNIRPPRADELPPVRLLTYGTSITHGTAATCPHLTYAAQAARGLGADLINLGSGGSCQCEPELADYIAGRDDWDIASLALSVNMMGFTNEAFYERVAYMVKTVAAADASRPVACITLWPYFSDWGMAPADQAKCGAAAEKRQLLRDAVAAADLPNLHILEGPEILTDITGLAGDLIHPADDGMIQMGRGLADRLRPLLPDSAARTG